MKFLTMLQGRHQGVAQALARVCFDFNLNALARSITPLALLEYTWIRERENDRWDRCNSK